MVLISLDLGLAHLSKVVGAVGIALKRAEIRRSIPRTSIERTEEVPRKAVSIANMLRTCLSYCP